MTLPAPFCLQALPSPQYAAGDLRRVEDDRVGEFQRPCFWRRIRRFPLECDEQLFSHQGRKWTEVLQEGLRADNQENCLAPRTLLGQVLSATDSFSC